MERGIYVHIPYCVKKCDYCDFVSVPVCGEDVDSYIAAIKSEIALLSETLHDFRASTIFIGGGTPSTMPTGAIHGLLDALYATDLFDTSAKNPEITIEANPGTVTQEKFFEYADCGINRVSIGLQSANDKLLAQVGRIHTFDDYLTAVDFARSAGFTNINADIMYGLPNQTTKDCVETVRRIKELDIPHVSAYSLILEEGTPLYTKVSGGLVLPNEDDEYAMHMTVREELISAGYGRYEISNYAKSGYNCRHNLNYWDCGEYVGIGLNSHSALRNNGVLVRRCNHSVFSDYYEDIKCGRLPISDSEEITHEVEMFEFIMLGTRKVCGVDVREFYKRFGTSLSDVYGDRLASAIDEGLVVLNSDALCFTERGLDLQNEILTRLL